MSENDRPALDADEIEITEEMIEAGYPYLLEYDANCGRPGRLVLADLFRAMVSASECVAASDSQSEA